MKTNVFLALDNRRATSDGTYTILLRIVHHRKSSQVTTGIHVKEQDWDAKKRVIKSSYKGTETVARVNNLLRKKRSEAMDIILKLEESKKLDSYSVLQLKELIDKKTQNNSFFTFGESLVKDLFEANRIGNAQIYRCALSVLRKFRNGKDLTFQELDHALLTKFETAHLKKGKSYNGLSVYLRSIRAIFNTAIKRGLVERDLYPFHNYEIKSVKTRKRAISFEAIKRIEKLKIDSSHLLYHTRNYFLVSFYLRGISFSDLAHLKVGNITDGRVNYQRQKTDKPYSIKITDEVRKVFDLYMEGKEKDDYILPIIKRVSAEEQYKDVQGTRKRFNKKLKKLATLCDIEDDLTSYVSRHSFATRAKNLGIPIASISDMLGHQNIKTTEVYLDSLPDDLLDKYHAKVISQPSKRPVTLLYT